MPEHADVPQLLAIGIAFIGASVDQQLYIRGTGNIAEYARPTIRAAFSMMPFAFGVPISPIGSPLALVVGAAVGLVLVLIRWRSVTRMMDRDLILFLPPVNGAELVATAYSLLLATFSEELLFRAAVLVVLYPLIGWWALPASILLFVGNHPFRRAAHYSVTDIAMISLMGLGAGLLFILTWSIGPSLAVHATFNSPLILQQWRSYWLHRHNH